MSEFNYTELDFTLAVYDLRIQENSIVFAACFINTINNTIKIAELIDNDFFTIFENSLIEMAPEHETTRYYVLVNIPREFYSQKLINVIEKVELVDKRQILIKQKEFLPNFNLDYVSSIKLIVKDFESNTIFMKNELTFALNCLNGWLNFSRILNFSQFLNRFEISKYNHSEHMNLDIACIKCLNIFDNLDDKKSMFLQKLSNTLSQVKTNTNKTSVFSILNQCETKFGSRLLKAWLLQPLQDIEEIVTRQNLVEAFVSSFSYTNELRSNFLSKIEDIQTININLTRYISNNKDYTTVKLVDLVKLERSIAIVKSMMSYLQLYEGTNEKLLKSRYIESTENLLEKLSKLQEMISRTVIFDEKTKDYLINYELSKDLAKIQTKIDSRMETITSIKTEIESELTGKNRRVKITEYLTHGYVLEMVKEVGEAFMKTCNNRFRLVTSNKASIVITNSEIESLNVELKQFKSEYKRIEKDYYIKVIDICSTYCPILEKLIYLLSELDVLSSFAMIVLNSKETYCKPVFTEDRNFSIKNSRHLILEWNEDIIKRNNPNNKNLVANDCFLETNANIKLITGINMGGKSTYLRQIGICVLLAHIGCYIPASSASLPIVDQIFTRVGAGDIMLKGVSTYMNEMIEVCSLIKSATQNSLMLIDELGRGTSTDDGIGISYGILNYIAKEIDCYCLFATHFFELTEMQLPNVKNYHVSYSVSELGQILMDYKLLEGCTNKSLGINLFKSMKFDDDTINCLEKFIETG